MTVKRQNIVDEFVQISGTTALESSLLHSLNSLISDFEHELVTMGVHRFVE